MTDLILHIGLSKCGSTTLQRKVFSHEPGYLGRTPGMALEENLTNEFLECGPFLGRQTTNRRGLVRWAERIRQIKAVRWPNVDRLILSHETLSSASRLDDRPFLKVASMLKNDIWREGRVKVVLVFRNQAARFASSYAQSSNSMWHPGQADFELYVKRHLSSRRHVRLLDFSVWIEGLNNAIGPENLCTLLLEDSGSVDFWQKLASFCHVEQFEPTRMVEQERGRENVRRRGSDRWILQPLDAEFRARADADKWVNLVWPTNLARGPRNKLRSWLRDHLRVIYARKAAALDPSHRETEIHLNQKIVQMIRGQCGAANNKLAVQLNRELASLNY